MKVLDLFSGIGGFSLGLERAGMETVAFCEIEEYPRKVLQKHWPDVPIYEDVRKLSKEELEKDGITDIELICGGYPCQPFSVAGKQRGEDDDRHLWPEMYRLIKTIRPRWVIAENVAGHINMGLDTVLSDLEAEAYTWWTFVIPACAVDAKHRRDRLWIVGNSEHDGPLTATKRGISEAAVGNNSQGQEKTRELEGAGRSPGDVIMGDSTDDRSPDQCGTAIDAKPEHAPIRGNGGAVADTNNARLQGGVFRGIPEKTIQVALTGCGENVADTERERQQGPGKPIEPKYSATSGEGQAARAVSGGVKCEWLTEPDVGRVANGVPGRVDRLKALGNAVVPQIPEIIGRAIMEVER